MESLSAYVIPVTTLRFGRNELDFNVDWRFFRHFEGSPVEQGSFEIKVLFDKFQDHWHLFFGVKGDLDTECDRCLAAISLPVSGDYELFVKFDEPSEANEETSADMIYVSKETTQFDISQYIYEFVVLSVPVTHVYACQESLNPPCDFEMLARLEQKDEQQAEGSPWDVLKELRGKPERVRKKK